MQKRIDELASGNVDCAEPVVEFSETRIKLEVFAEEDFTGNFFITSKNEIPIRGIVVSTHPRMQCLTPEFEGTDLCISYQFHSGGLSEGDIQKGDFYIICNQGEYNLSFVVEISKPAVTSAAGKPLNLLSFASLARENFYEAKKIFCSARFSNIFGRKQAREALLYEGIKKGARADKNLEEFLIACGLKEPVSVTVGQKDFTFSEVKETLRQEVEVVKSTWGYVEFDIKSDASFIEPEKDRLTLEDFLGSSASVGFYLYPQRMHAGKNFACVRMKNISQEIVLTICATPASIKILKNHGRKELKKRYQELSDVYLDYRLKKIVTGKWASVSCRILENMAAHEPKNVWYRLLKAQALLVNGQKQEAEWILSAFRQNWKDKNSPQWGYYLYLCTLTERQEIFVNRLTGEIEEIYLEHRENHLLFWCLLFLKKEYTNNRSQKLRAIRRRILGGAYSPFFYVEVYSLFCQEPYLINELGGLECKVLNWARRRGVLTKPLAEQIVDVFSEKLAFHNTVFSLLEACDRLLGDKRTLSVICSYLIRSQKYGNRYFMWYEKGVAAQLHIAGLYEAYLISMDPRNVQEVPKIIPMYFKYHNRLPRKQRAVLYVNIIASKAHQPEIYKQHYPAMEAFACEQMKLGHMDDNLAVIYDEVLSSGTELENISDALSPLLFVHRLTCFLPEAVRVIVLQKQTCQPKVVPLIEGAAYFPLYSNDYGIFIEDYHGNRYGGSVPYQLEKLMYPGKYLRSCMRLSPGKLPCLLYYFTSRMAQDIFEEKDLEYFHVVMKSGEVKKEYKAELFVKLFRLLSLLGRTEEMESELSHMDISLLQAKDRDAVLGICMEQRLFEQSCAIVAAYGFGKIQAEQRVPFLSHWICHVGAAREEKLLSYCVETFLLGKYNDDMLDYLCRYYQGPAKVMASVFQSARSFGVDTRLIAERILVQMLYTGKFVGIMDEIYQSYAPYGSSKIKKAYLTYFSYCGFVKDMVLPEHFCSDLESYYEQERTMNEVCELLFLRCLSEQGDVTLAEKQYEDELLLKYLSRGMLFSFFQKLHPDCVRKYLLHERYVIEYHTKAQSKVWLHYKMQDSEEEYATESMTEIYEGIFVKEFLLFSGESVWYYISDGPKEKEEVTHSGALKCVSVQTDAAMSRYDRLCAMNLLGEEAESLAASMRTYQAIDDMVNETFTILS